MQGGERSLPRSAKSLHYSENGASFIAFWSRYGKDGEGDAVESVTEPKPGLLCYLIRDL